MWKKIGLGILIGLALGALGVNFAARKAPVILRAALERSLGKSVRVDSIHYHFPDVFLLEGFQIRERGMFSGETSFAVERVKLVVSPMSLSKKALVVDKIEIENAAVFLRKYHGRWSHPLSNVMQTENSDEGTGAAGISDKKIRRSEEHTSELQSQR